MQRGANNRIKEEQLWIVGGEYHIYKGDKESREKGIKNILKFIT